MSFVIKISNDYLNPTAQFIDPPNIRFEDQIENIGSMTFTLALDDPQLYLIAPYKKIALYEITGGDDVLIWSGFVERIEATFDGVEILSRTEKGFLAEKLIFEEKNLSNEPIEDFLDTLVTEANARSGGVRGELSYETNLSENITKLFTKGTSYLSILNELAVLFECEWTVSLNEIIFKDTIGMDRTSGENFIELVSTLTSPVENNITQITSVLDGREITTSLIGKASSSYEQANANTDAFGHVERLKSFGDGSLAELVAAELETSSIAQLELTLDINTTKINYRNANIGDLLAVRIDRNNVFLDLDDSLKVIRKIVSIENGQPVLFLTVSNAKKKVVTADNVIGELAEVVRRLELQ